MFDRIDNLRRFISIVEHRTLHQAAVALGLTQPALSRTVKLLEAEFGGALFTRQSRGVQLTELGERVLVHAQHILRECQLADADIAALRSGESGLLRLHAGPIWMNSILPWSITQFNDRYPNLKLSLRSAPYISALGELKTGKLDISCGGFQHLQGLPSYLVRKPMFTVTLAIHAREAHPLLQRDRITPEDLLDYPWISFQDDDAYFNIVMDQISLQAGRRVTPTVYCESLLTALALLREGNFLAFLPCLPAGITPGPPLRHLPTSLPLVTFDSGMVFRRSLLNKRGFCDFLDIVGQRIKDCALT